MKKSELKQIIKEEIQNNSKKDLIKKVNQLLKQNPNLSQEDFDWEEGEYISGGEIQYLKAFIKWLLKNKK